MANVKITELTAATALAGTDVLPIVDVGADATKKVSVSDLLRNLPDGTASAPALAFADDQNTGVLSPAANELAFATSGTQRLVIDSSGRVGVGTSTLTGNSGSLSILKDSSLYWRKPNGQIKGDILVDDSENIIFNQGASSTEVARIDSSGRLLLGTTTPGVGDADEFTVAGSGNIGITIRSGTTSSGNIFFSDATSGTAEYDGYIQYRHNDRALRFATAATERMRIDSSGNVGIGTAAPNSYSGYTTLTINNATTGAVLDLEVNGTRTGTFLAASGQVQLGTKTSAVLRFDTNDTERMRIDSSGNVGIGLTSPTEFVDIRKDQNAFTWAQIQNQNSSSGAYAGIQFGAHGNTWGIANGSSAANSNSLIFVTDAGGSNSEKMRIDSSGRLLVGTSTSPSGGDAHAQNASLLIQGRIGNVADSGRINLQRGSAASNGSSIGTISFTDNSNNAYARLEVEADTATGSNDYPGRIKFSTTADGESSPTERMRITSGGDLLFGKTGDNFGTAGAKQKSTGALELTANGAFGLAINRLTDDGELVRFYQATTQEGSITVSGTTVSYNGAHLSRWSQLASGAARSEILRGSVLSNLDEMCEWGEEDNEQLNRMKVSDVEGDVNVSGVFQAWDDDDDTYTNDFYCAMTGDFVIRIAQGTTVARGDLLMSAGDGTAKPQDDDIVRSKTIAKVTSTTVSTTYADGSYCVPCVLMAC